MEKKITFICSPDGNFLVALYCNHFCTHESIIVESENMLYQCVGTNTFYQLAPEASIRETNWKELYDGTRRVEKKPSCKDPIKAWIESSWVLIARKRYCKVKLFDSQIVLENMAQTSKELEKYLRKQKLIT